MKRGREGPPEEDQACIEEGDGGSTSTTVPGPKGVRRSVSCIKCRQRKVKCEPVTADGPAYPCSRCTRMKLECTDPRTVEAELDEVGMRSQHLLKLMNKGIDKTDDEERTRALITLFTQLYRRWILMGKSPMNGVVANHMRSLLKPLLAKEGLDLEHYLSMLTPLQGPAGITIDGQYLTHEGEWGSQLAPYVKALYHEAYATIGLVAIEGSDRFVVNQSFADHFFTSDEAEHVSLTQDVIRPTIMAAVLAPEERPRFEKTLQDMTVCLTPACELTSVYKVRLLKMGVSVMAVVRYRLLFVEQGHYYAFVMALSPLPMHASAPKRGPQGDRRAVLQCCNDADPWLECAKAFGEWDALSLRPPSSPCSSEGSDGPRPPRAPVPVLQESGMHCLLESLQRLPSLLANADSRPTPIPPSPPTPIVHLPPRPQPPRSSAAPSATVRGQLGPPWPGPPLPSPSLSCPALETGPPPPSPPEVRRYPDVARAQGRQLGEGGRERGEATQCRRGPSVLGEPQAAGGRPGPGHAYDAVGVHGYDAAGRREYRTITREPAPCGVPPDAPSTARAYAHGSGPPPLPSRPVVVAPPASLAAGPRLALDHPPAPLSPLQQQLLNLPMGPLHAPPRSASTLGPPPPASSFAPPSPLLQVPSEGADPRFSAEELMRVFANDGPPIHGPDVSDTGGGDLSRVESEQPGSATWAGTQAHAYQDADISMGVEREEAPMHGSSYLRADSVLYPKAHAAFSQQYGWR